MSTTGLVISVVIAALGLAWLALPLVRRSAAADGGAVTREREVLLTTYERILATVRDLDEDYQIGKVSPDAYNAERAHWTEKGAAVLQALEKTGSPHSAHAKILHPAQKAAETTSADDPIEQAIAAYVRAREQAGD
jgi:hypothetical protein